MALGGSVDPRILKAKGKLGVVMAMVDEFINRDLHPSVFPTERARLEHVQAILSKVYAHLEEHVRSQDVDVE